MPEFVYVVYSPELFDIEMVTTDKEQANLKWESLRRLYPQYLWTITSKVLGRGLDI